MYRKILVPIDGSETSNLALQSAVQLAKTFGASLRLTHVVEKTAYLTGYDPMGGYTGDLVDIMRESGTKLLDDAVARVQAAGVAADTVMFDNLGERLAETVAQAARDWGAELILLGTHGRRGVGRCRCWLCAVRTTPSTKLRAASAAVSRQDARPKAADTRRCRLLACSEAM